jgi:nucleotide-binding universal stress UspA family protein
MALPLHPQNSMASKLFHRIVVPTDFSDCAEEAWALTQRMASRLDSEVVLAHVFVEPTLYGEEPLTPDTTWQVFEKARKWVEGELEKWAAAARKKGATVRPVIRTGSPPEQIVELATSEHADLVVMGTHGRGGVSRVLLGSVADRVIRLAPCPVLTVRKPE